MKLGSIVHPQFQESLKKLMKLDTIPPSAAFKLRGLARQVKDEAAKFDEVKNQYINNYGQRSEDGKILMDDLGGGRKGVKIMEDKIEELKIKLDELNGLDIDLPNFSFKDDLASPKLSPEDLFHLEFIVE